MSVKTQGKIKGFVKHEEVLNFIRQKWDPEAVDKVWKEIVKPLAECNWDYKVNEHSEDQENWYAYAGFIIFVYEGEKRMLYYNYDNIKSFDNLEYYREFGLEDMVTSETTDLSLGYYGGSVEIIKAIVAHFGGGWIDEDDCDDEKYYPVKDGEECI